LNDKVQVKVLEVDIPRKRIALSIKQTQEAPARQAQRPNFKTNKPSPSSAPATMDDALSLLKRKFGKG